jgi:hypothetical protein
LLGLRLVQRGEDRGEGGQNGGRHYG